MKKYLIFASAAILALAGCAKEIKVQAPVDNSEEIVLTFTSAKPEFESEDETITRTSWNSAKSCIEWDATDKIRVGYTLDGDWMGQEAAGTAKFYASKEVTIDDDDNKSIGTFQVPITGNGTTAFTDPSANGTYKFYGIYPSTILTNTTVNDPTAHNVTLAANQTPGSNTFDHTADIMVGESEDMALTGLPTDPIELNWNRVVGHVALTFSNMGFVGNETPNKITLTFNEAAKVAGTFSINITDGTIGAGTANEIILEGSGLSVSGSSINAWATVLPVSFSSLNVEIKTDKATYTRNIASFNGGAKTFKKNARNTLTVNMQSANREAATQYDWVETPLASITSSDVFVIVGNNGNTYAMSNDKAASAAPDAIAVTIANNKLSAAPADKIQWNLSKDGSNYTFYPNGTTKTWLYVYNNNNGLRVGTGDDKVFIVSDDYLYNSGQSRYIGVYNSSDWRSYTSINNNIKNQTFAFYVRTVATPSKPVPTISFGAPTTEVNIGETVTNVATIDPSGLAITYSSSNQNVATVSNAGVVTGVAAGTATITASFAGNDTYDAASAEYDITVVNPSSPNDGTQAHPFTVAEVRSYMDASESNRGPVYIQGTVSSVYAAYDQTHGTGIFYISDDGETSSAQFEAYSVKFLGNNAWLNGNTQIAVGDNVIIYGGELTIYNSSIYETKSNSGSYLYSLNGSTAAETVPTITKTDISGVSYEGVTNATTTVSFTNNEGWSASAEGDGTVVTSASISGTTVTYSVASNNGGARVGTITITLSKSGRTNATAVISVGQNADPNNTSKTYTIVFTPNTTFTTFTNSYTKSFVNTCDGLELTLTNINNGASPTGWSTLRAGRNNNNASVATITTNAVIPEAIKTVTLHVTQVDVSLLTHAKLFVSSNSNFSSASESSFSITGTGNVSATVASPAANKYYKIEISLAAGSSNGHFRFDQIVYTTN